ncbi:aminotransferase class I/II-fold pyridoxal phosphate-dependent enzyme [Sphingomonas sp. RHCKR7]|uniref:aminotransferase class I/II-fold pyridoxal phosphate-dependent enzyme n=1 Tax=Sphingomonas folli TaxID=2862497 RepID=UPI001CA4F1B1|nr:aminotransferase class I/II-fold pyridoxal phosphate-dependent enzyme [Sphingomonas folli]MBW6526107.1 aminotransferase class I/II-fold pyridoxal phosphate-dependent enzyme [Sphingomonas folli]
MLIDPHSEPAGALTYHGGRADAAARLYPDAPAPWLDLSTGINPFAWEGGDVPLAALRALPSPAELAELHRAAAAAFEARDAAITALPGSEIGLHALAGLGLPRPWHVVAPSYRTHAAALPGAATIEAAVAEAVARGGGTLLLANPNNPDGRCWPAARLLELARAIGERGGVLVIDEAFADAVPGASALPYLARDDRVLVFRSFGKFFGLAGVRLGFALGGAELVGALAARLGSWPVSTAALRIGTAAYRDAAWIAATRERLAAAAASLDGVLTAHGLVPLGACPLFRLVEHVDAPLLFERLARAGILVRPFDESPARLRLGLPGDAAALARLDAALRDR